MRFTFTIDSTDPERLVTFWAAALGYTAVGEFGASMVSESVLRARSPLVGDGRSGWQ